jgi:competence protein ComEC
MAPILWVTPAWLLGIFLQGWLNFEPGWLWLGAITAFIFALSYFILKRVSPSFAGLPLLLPLCLLAFCLGALRYDSSLLKPGPENTGHWAGDFNAAPELRVKGVVSGDPIAGEKSTSLRLNTREIWPPGASGFQPVKGDIHLTLEKDVTVRPGDLLELSGRLQKPREFTGDNFPYREYLERQGIYAVMYRPSAVVLDTGQDFFLFLWLNDIQNHSLEIINRFMEPREAGLLGGILLGETRSIDPEVKEAFRLTGSSHIVAISGANITIAAGAFMLIFGRLFHKRTALILTLAGIAAYVLLVGGSPGVLRAGIMGGIAIVGLIYGREYFSLYSLCGAVLIQTLYSPQAFYDIGFELSAVATLGLILIAAPLQQQGWVQKLPGIYREGFIVGFGAEVMTTPLVIYYFQQISPVSMPTSVIGLPLLPIIMASGALLVAGGWLFAGLFPVLVYGLGWLSWLFTASLVEVVDFFARIPFASIELPQQNPYWLVIYYSGVAALIAYWRSGPQGVFRQQVAALVRSPLGLGALVLGSGLLCALVFL